VPSHDPFQPTERERRVINVLASVWAIFGVAVIVTGNVTGLWWPAIVEVALLAVLVVGTTMWVARSRNQRPWPTFLQVIRTRQRA
jgi:hypothetical protein